MMRKITVLRNGETIHANANDGETLLEALARAGVAVSAPCGGRGRCKKCEVTVIGEEKKKVLACQTVICGDMQIEIDSSDASILTHGTDARISSDGEKGFGVAVDIGTTTLAAYLLDLETGETLASDAMLNPQRVHGSDVVSRITYANESIENSRLLQSEMLSALSQMTERLYKKANIECIENTSRVCVGNTVMMHLLGGYSVKGLAVAPFAPEYTEQHTMSPGGVNTLMGGCVAGFVGADTVAAALACDLDIKDEVSLLLDIGTNGEIVAVKNGKMACCSCAAGPAFEGAHIACGIGAVTGAVDHVKLNGDSLSYTTIGGAPAVGICGSGLIDAIAVLIERGDISPIGRLAGDTHISDSVYISRSDVRETQLAKAAIAAGIEILMTELDISYSEISHVYLAGGFGNYISVENACAIGMLPQELKDRVVSVGNAAGEGAKLLLASSAMRTRAEALRKRMEYIELASRDDFADIYADNLPFGEL